MKEADIKTEYQKLAASNPITYQSKVFSALQLDELYSILALRAEVFVVEQECPYQDLDGKDQKAVHLLQYSTNELVGYARMLSAQSLKLSSHVLGRIVIREKFRSIGLGHALVEEAIKMMEQMWGNNSIKISAQQHLTYFYEKHNFQVIGAPYLEDGIPHIAMIRPAN